LDHQLEELMLQLIHLLKFEPFPDIALPFDIQMFENLPNISLTPFL